jgi:hypothetical protein
MPLLRIWFELDQALDVECDQSDPGRDAVRRLNSPPLAQSVPLPRLRAVVFVNEKIAKCGQTDGRMERSSRSPMQSLLALSLCR